MALPDSIGLDELNSGAPHQARAAFLACCSSPVWADRMAQGRPYADEVELLAAGDSVLAELSDADVSEALAGHARIGTPAPGAAGEWSRREQAGMSAADADLSQAMAEGNAAYEGRFGHVYLISAAGRSAAELLAALQSRLGHDPDTERAIVRAELGKINRLRLQRLLAPAPPTGTATGTAAGTATATATEVDA